MSNLATISPIEAALIGGDLKNLTTEQRLSYFKQTCESLGLNPLTKPFEFIQLNGKLTLYARRDATDQLRRVHKVSTTITARERSDDVYMVTAKAVDKDGREDESVGAVSIAGLKGEALANAMMKAETKAKRRVTLSICGLGMLDETEVDTIPREAVQSIAEEFLLGEPADPIKNNCGDYVIQLGKYKGQAIKDIDPYALNGYINWMRDGSQKANKPLTGNALDLMNNAEVYLHSLEPKRGA